LKLIKENVEMWKVSFAEKILDNLPNLKANKNPKRSIGSREKSEFIKYLSGNLARSPLVGVDIGKFYYPEKWNVCP